MTKIDVLLLMQIWYFEGAEEHQPFWDVIHVSDALGKLHITNVLVVER